jgi:membrane protein DedA with SNARE-associated domain
MELTGQQIFDFIAHNGYWVIVPLMIIEGPIATIMAAILASLGALNIWVVLLLSILGDVFGDLIFYAAGYFWGMKFVKRVGKYIGITESLIIRMENYFERHGGKTIFSVKSTTGLCWATFTAAGIVKMNFIRFLKYSVLGGIFWSGFLVAMGYFYGYMWREIKQYIEWAGWIIVLLAIVTFVFISLFKSYKSRQIFRKNSN